MVKSEINYAQIRKAIQKLPVKDRIKLARDLQQETWQKQFKQILKNIDARLKKNPISQKEIRRIVEEAKEEYHAKTRR